MLHIFFFFFFFFFNDTATTEIYTLSLHDALPIWPGAPLMRRRRPRCTNSVLSLRRSSGHEAALVHRLAWMRRGTGGLRKVSRVASGLARSAGCGGGHRGSRGFPRGAYGDRREERVPRLSGGPRPHPG